MSVDPVSNIEIPACELLEFVKEKHDSGYRLAQIGCGQFGHHFEINYTFEKDLKFENLRVVVSGDTEMPSISDIYWAAFIYENELHDMYGIKVNGINIDFNGTLIKTSVQYPLRTTPEKTEEGE